MADRYSGSGKFVVVVTWKNGDRDIEKFETKDRRDHYFKVVKGRKSVLRKSVSKRND